MLGSEFSSPGSVQAEAVWAVGGGRRDLGWHVGVNDPKVTLLGSEAASS